MLINQSFVFLIVISFVCQVPICAWARQESDSSFRSMGSNCWNGLGKCDDLCDGDTTRKIDYSCEELHTCCVAKKLVLPVNSVENHIEEDGVDQSCALNNGKCHVKCLPPTTVYRGSINECPLRYFCCISNPSKSSHSVQSTKESAQETDDSEQESDHTTQEADDSTQEADHTTQEADETTQEAEDTTQKAKSGGKTSNSKQLTKKPAKEAEDSTKEAEESTEEKSESTESADKPIEYYSIKSASTPASIQGSTPESTPGSTPGSTLDSTLGSTTTPK